MSFLRSIFNVPKRQKIGNYQMIKELGHGNFGIVYLARDPSTGEYVAIKKFQNDRNEIDIPGFTKEADILLTLSHPNIVKVLNFGLENDGSNNVPYLVMKYLPNKDLETFLKDRLPLSIKEVVVYINAIAAALQHAHNQDIIHRDVKPKNILCGSNGEILLSDFGIATHVGANGQQTAGNIIGTSAYIAPEQIRGQATPASDQYSLAVVAYKWLCNALPFRNEEEHLKMPPPPFPKALQIPIEVEKVIRKALEKQPTKRYDSVQQFAEALEKAYQDYIARCITTIEKVKRSKEDILETPPFVEQPETPSQRERAIILGSYLLNGLLFSCGWGATVGILLHSWLLAVGVAFLLNVVFLLRKRMQFLNALPAAMSISNAKGNVVFCIAFFLSIAGSALAAKSMAFSLLLLPYSVIDLNGMPIGPQIYLGLGAGIITTLVVGIVLTLASKTGEYSWLHLLVFSLLFGLAIVLVLYMMLGLGIGTLRPTTSLVVGVIAMTGTITLVRRRKKL